MGVLYWVPQSASSALLELPDPALVQYGRDPGREDHVAEDVHAIAVDHQVEPVGAVGDALERKEGARFFLVMIDIMLIVK